MPDTQTTSRMLISVEKRADGMWRVELVGGNDGSSMPGSEFKPRRKFLMEYHRALEQLDNLVFHGAVRKMRR